VYNPIWYLSAILAFVGMVLGALRLITARRLKSRFGKTSIGEQQETLQTDMRKIQQLMYSPIAFLLSCGILFPLIAVISVFGGLSRVFEALALAGSVDIIAVYGGIADASFAYGIILIITFFVWALYFFFNHAHRKLILDMCCLAGNERLLSPEWEHAGSGLKT
jgi:hypothetical protein